MNPDIYFITQSDLARVIRILLKALSYISTNYTNKGYKVPTKEGLKTCVLGALDIASLEVTGKHIHDSDLAVTIVNSTALQHYKVSAVTLSDDLGYAHVIKLFSLSLERAFEDAARIGPNVGRVEYRSA